MLQALLAYLLARCGDDRSATIAADELVDRFRIPAEDLQDHLSLLNLVNFGGGCYTVYAELRRRPGVRRQGAVRRDVPGGAAPDAPRGARDPARARVRRADDRRGGAHAARARAQEARGDVRPVRARADAGAARRREEESFVSTFSQRSASGGSSRSSTRRRARRRRRRGSSSRTRSSASCRTGASTPGIAPATASAASASTGCAARRCSRRRSRRARDSSRAGCATRAWHTCCTRRRSRAGRSSGARARSRTARRSPRSPSAAPSGSMSEIFSFRGEAVVLEPEDLRRHVRDRAKELVARTSRQPPANPHVASVRRAARG